MSILIVLATLNTVVANINTTNVEMENFAKAGLAQTQEFASS